jgi:RES domain-containing protein
MLYRVRTFESEAPCATTHELGYPPPGVAGMGRANRAGNQVLYVATSPVVAVKEAKVAPGQHFVVAEFAIRKNLGLLHVGVWNSPERDFISHMAKGAASALNELDVFGRQNVHEAHRWLGELFLAEDRTRYPLSVALAEILLRADGFVFPSLFERRQYNIVLNTAAADDKLVPGRYWRGVLDGHAPINGEVGIQSRLYDHATQLDEQRIMWTGLPPAATPTDGLGASPNEAQVEPH